MHTDCGGIALVQIVREVNIGNKVGSTGNHWLWTELPPANARITSHRRIMKFKTLCQQGARLIDWPEGVNGFAVLWAIGGVESSFGSRAVPKYEKAYDWGGPYSLNNLLLEHGSLAACSLGPWQIMYVNVHTITNGEVKPLHMYEPATALIVTCMWMQKIIKNGAVSISGIADAWNSGTHKDGLVPHDYIRKVKAIYDDVIQAPQG